MKPFLSVIIPVYNEAKRIPLTLVDVDKRLRGAEYSSEIIVVDDGSRDSTVEIVKRFRELIPNLRLIENKENHGKGFVVRQGMLSAKGNWRLFMDADNSTTVDHFDKMRPYLSSGRNGYDVIIGSRDVKGAELVPPQPFHKRILGFGAKIIIRLMFLWEFLDSQCGFKCFSEEAAKRVFPFTRINRWGFDVEVLALAKKMGFRVKEMPVTWINNPYSHVKLTSYLFTFLEVLKVRWWISRGNYHLES